MTNRTQGLPPHLHGIQMSSIHEMINFALPYHYKHIEAAEMVLRPHIQHIQAGLQAGKTPLPETPEIRIARMTWKCEVIAYLNQLGRLWHFLKSMIDQKFLNETDIAWLEMAVFFRKKWAAHRSFDDPYDETESFHIVVLTQDLGLTWGAHGKLMCILSDNDGNPCMLDIIGNHQEYMGQIEKTLSKLEAASKN